MLIRRVAIESILRKAAQRQVQLLPGRLTLAYNWIPHNVPSYIQTISTNYTIRGPLNSEAAHSSSENHLS